MKNKISKSRLEKMDVPPLNSSNLRSLNSEDLKNVFTDLTIKAYWDQIEPEILGLQLPEMTGGVNPGDQKALFYLLKNFNYESVLEVGTHLGCSTVNMALALRGNESESKQIITVDLLDVNDKNRMPWKEYGSKHSPEEMITKLKCQDFVTFKVSPSLSFMSACQEKFDLIFLDGDHSAPAVFEEVPIALNLLKPGGLILLHDYFPNGIPLWKGSLPGIGPNLAVERLLKTNSDIQVLPLGELPWKTKLNSCTTSLALLAKT